MAFPFYLKVHGSRQGDFKGESSNRRRIGWIECLDFQLGVQSPRDQPSGQAAGKRQWKPIIIVKEWGAASPQFLQALVTNEVLSSVILEFESVLADGTEGTYYAFQLTNASVTEVHQYVGRDQEQSTETQELERIEFTFEKINVEHKAGNTTFSDDWLA